MVVALMAAVAAWSAGPVADTGPPIPEEPEVGFVHTVLDNGLTVSIYSDPRMPVVATQHWVRVGGAHEAPDQRGFAHLFEHMMFSATETRERGEYARFHTRVGGSDNAFTHSDRTVYHSVVAPEHHDAVLQMEAERLHALVLDPEQMAIDRRVVTEELRQREGTPMSRLGQRMVLGLLGDHPYARGPLGTREDIAARTVEDARAFYEAYYRPDFLHLVVAGPVDGPATLARITELYGALTPSGASRPTVEPLTELALPPYLELSERIPPVKMTAVAYPLPPMSHPDAPAIRMLLRMLSGEDDPFEVALVEERGKALGAWISSTYWREGGLLMFVSVSLPTRRTARAFALVDETVDELAKLDWNTPEAVEASRRVALRQHHFGTFSAQGMANRIGFAEWMLGDMDQALDNTGPIQGVTPEDIARVWRTWVTDGTPTRVFLHRGRGGTP